LQSGFKMWHVCNFANNLHSNFTALRRDFIFKAFHKHGVSSRQILTFRFTFRIAHLHRKKREIFFDVKEILCLLVHNKSLLPQFVPNQSINGRRLIQCQKGWNEAIKKRKEKDGTILLSRVHIDYSSTNNRHIIYVNMYPDIIQYIINQLFHSYTASKQLCLRNETMLIRKQGLQCSRDFSIPTSNYRNRKTRK
jgi:hypothetical protein